MFTSRAEFRTLLRQDNADLRLTELSYRLGLASQERMDKVRAKKDGVLKITKILEDASLEPAEAATYLSTRNSAALVQKQKAFQILLRPNIDLKSMTEEIPKLHTLLAEFPDETLEQAEIQIKYNVYIEKERDLAARIGQLEELAIPENFDYDKISGISAEALQKFKKIKPRTLGQASRISGVNPSDVQILMVYMGI